MSQKSKRPWAIALGLAGIALSLVYFFLFDSEQEIPEHPETYTGPRIVIIGLDGAEWQVINPLIAEDRLPNLKKLIDSGVSGPLRTIEPILSPIVWTTIATGRDPADHGIGWFMSDTKDGKSVPITSTSRKVKALWNIASEHERSVSVLGWWATYPAEEVNGESSTRLAFGSRRMLPRPRWLRRRSAPRLLWQLHQCTYRARCIRSLGAQIAFLQQRSLANDHFSRIRGPTPWLPGFVRLAIEPNRDRMAELWAS